MKDRLLKFDTIVAACALLMSTVTAGAMLYQTRVIADQFSASTWPYLSVQTTYNPASVEIDVTNNGAGPALIRSAQLSVDGKPVSGWNNLVDVVTAHIKLPRGGASFGMASVDASTAVRPGDSDRIFTVKAPVKVIDAARRHSVALDFCYCSIGDRCWTLHDVIGSNGVYVPQPAAFCKIGASIGSPLAI